MYLSIPTSQQMTLVGDFDMDGLVAVDRLMAQVLVGTYFCVAGVICMNLYIALLTDTFARVYALAIVSKVLTTLLKISKSRIF